MNTILFRLLGSFTQKEKRQFVRSPFLKSSKEIIRLYDHIKKYFPEFDSENLEMKKIFTKLYPDKNYNEKKIRTLIFALTKAAEDFLIFDSIKKNAVEYKLRLSGIYFSKDLTDKSNSLSEKVQEKLKNSFQKKYFINCGMLASLNILQYAEDNDFENLANAIHEFFRSGLLQFAINYIEYLNDIRTVDSNYFKKTNSDFIEEIKKLTPHKELFELIKKYNYFDNIFIRMFCISYNMIMDEGNTSYYFELKELLKNNLKFLDHESKHYFFTHLTNYGIRIVITDRKFVREIVEIYGLTLKEKIFSQVEGKNMEIKVFRNLVLIYASLNEADVLKFLAEEQIKSLEKSHRTNFRDYAFAFYYFAKKDFANALMHANKIILDTFFYKTDVKNLLIKIHYELKNYEKVKYLLDALKHFIKNNKDVSEEFRVDYNYHIKFAEQITKLRLEESTEGSGFIKKEIEKTEFSGKRWLYEKICELINEKV